jgi:hypothetical protein
MGADDLKADADENVVLSKPFGESVENGSAHDKATLNLGDLKRIAIPEGPKSTRMMTGGISTSSSRRRWTSPGILPSR